MQPVPQNTQRLVGGRKGSGTGVYTTEGREVGVRGCYEGQDGAEVRTRKQTTKLCIYVVFHTHTHCHALMSSAPPPHEGLSCFGEVEWQVITRR